MCNDEGFIQNVPLERIGLSTSSLPRMRSTTELQRLYAIILHHFYPKRKEILHRILFRNLE